MDRLPASLDSLGAARHALPAPAGTRRRFEELQRFERLSQLWLLDCWPKDSVAPLAGLTGLVRLHATAPSGWSQLRSLTRLEQVAAIRPRLANLKAFSHWERLRQLTLTGAGVKSLTGVEALRGLERLSAVMIAASDLSPLGGLPALEEVRLVGLTRVADLSPLATLPALRRLTFTRASREFSDIQHVPSLGVLGSAASLEDLDLEGIVVDDGSLDGLVALPRLRSVRVFGDLGPAVERLRRARPEIEVRWSGAERPPGELVEGVYLRPPAPGLPRWWLREDLSSRLGVGTNADAEDRLRAALAGAAPELLARLEFDSEAAAVIINAATEADLRAVARILSTLARGDR